MTIIKQLKPFWIYISIISAILALTYINSRIELIIIYLVWLPITNVFPFIFGPFLAKKVNKYNFTSIRQSMFMSLIILFFNFIALNVINIGPYIQFYKTTNNFLTYFIYHQGELWMLLFPSILTGLLFYIRSLVSIKKARKLFE